MLALLLNPSTADECADDPTVTRMTRRAKALGFGGLYVCNLFALRSTDPKALYSASDAVGPENDRHILETAQKSRMVVAGWGIHGSLMGRSKSVQSMLEDNGIKMVCLGKTKDGHPRHPLYVGYSVEPFPLHEA